LELNKKIEWVLRIGVFGTFLGHGIFAFLSNPDWVSYLTIVGFSTEWAMRIMPVIGTIDILVAIVTLFKPLKPVLIYAVIWAFLTALVRPVAGESILTFIERAANWAAPLALYFVILKSGNKKP
jgi:hypothetical protein